MEKQPKDWTSTRLRMAGNIAAGLVYRDGPANPIWVARTSLEIADRIVRLALEQPFREV